MSCLSSPAISAFKSMTYSSPDRSSSFRCRKALSSFASSFALRNRESNQVADLHVLREWEDSRSLDSTDHFHNFFWRFGIGE